MKKNLLKLILVLSMIFSTIASLPAQAAIEGDGTEESPFLITEEEHLFLLEDFPTSCFKLANDIEMTGNITKPLCSNCDSQAFRGVLDGDGHTLYNLKMVSEGYSEEVSLFRNNMGVIKNLNIENADIRGRASYVIAINNFFTGEIINCSVSGFVGGGPGYAHGIVGSNNGTITGCRVSGELRGCSASFGITKGNHGTISGCVVTAELSAGYNYGIAGSNLGTIENCEFSGTINYGSATKAAGIAEVNGATITGGNGTLYRDAVISGCKVKADLHVGDTHDSVAAGICIENYTLIKNSYFIGGLSARSVGGIAVKNGQEYYDGYFEPETIENCYVVSSLNFTDSGNIIAENNDRSITSNCFFDKNVSQIFSDLNAKAVSTTGMKVIQTYRDYWDFDSVWGIDESINDGYPYLLWEQDNHGNSDDADIQHFLSELNNSDNPQDVKNLVLTYGEQFGYDIAKYEILLPSSQERLWHMYASRVYDNLMDAIVYFDELVDALRNENNNSGSSGGGGGGGGETVYSGSCGDNINWVFENGTLTIDGTGEMYDYDEGMSPWNDLSGDISSVCISDEITKIGRNSFRNLTALKTVILPESITEIHSCAFENSGIEEIELPSRLERIEDGAFRSCGSLKSIVIPDSVTYMSDSVFHFCYQLENAVVSNGLTELERNMFDECINLREITLPEGLTRIGNDAFHNTPLMDESNYVKGILYIDNYLIKAKNYIVHAQIREGTTLIGTNAFSGNFNMTDIVIPDSVAVINESAFGDCNSLKNITLHKSITEIGERAFEGCGSLEKAIFEGTSEEWERVNVAEGNTSLTDVLKFSEESETEPPIDIQLVNEIYLVTPLNLCDGNYVVFVCYEGDKTVYTDYWRYSGEGVYPFCTGVNYDKVKFLVWESIETLRPLCSAVER